ncbi:hypothetical protein AA313_de0208779 [Arthrobotrys entomopaga]|nr:hypothetical protein AA313_de0208779 [Arthrobotrys entomopaga]
MASREFSFKFFTNTKRAYASSTQWDAHREFIEEKLENNVSLRAIIEALKDEKDVTIKMHQLKRCLGDWGLSKRNLMLKQRHFIWSVFRQHKSGETSVPRPKFFFKRDNQVVSEEQVDEVLKENESIFLGYQNHNGKSPGLSYSIQPTGEDTLSIDNSDHVDENENDFGGAITNSPINETSTGIRGNTNRQTEQNSTPELDLDAGALNERDHISEGMNESNEATELPNPIEKTEESPEAVQTVCQEILDSVDSFHTAVSITGEVESAQRQQRDYSVEFSVELEEWIAHEKRVASLFLQNMDEERVRSNGTLDTSECYSRVRARWYQKPPDASIPVDWDPLPYPIYRQLQHLDTGLSKRVRAPRHNLAVWEEMRLFYTQHIDEVAIIYTNNVVFRHSGAHYLTLVKRFGPGHHLTIRAFAAFVLEVSSSTQHQLPIRIFYKLLHLFKELGMQTYMGTINVLQCLYETICREPNEAGKIEYLKDLIPLCQLSYKILEAKVRQGAPVQVIYEKYLTVHRIGIAHLLNEDNENGVSIIKHARHKMLRVRRPATISEWWAYGRSWYRIGMANMSAQLPKEAKLNFQSAYEAMQHTITAAPLYRDYSFNCLTCLGDA